MRATTYSTAALAMLSSFWSPVSGVAVGQDSTSGPFGGKQHAHTLVHMDITDGVPTGEPVLGFPISNSTDVAARRNVDYCIANAAQTGNCIQVAAFLSAIGVGIASIMKSDSDHNDCTTHSGEFSVRYITACTLPASFSPHNISVLIFKPHRRSRRCHLGSLCNR
jgi:hypothetical protein